MSRRFSSRLRTWRMVPRRSSSSCMAMSPRFVLYRRHWLWGSEIVPRLTRKLTAGSRITCLRRRSSSDGRTDQNRDANAFTAGVTGLSRGGKQLNSNSDGRRGGVGPCEVGFGVAIGWGFAPGRGVAEIRARALLKSVLPSCALLTWWDS